MPGRLRRSRFVAPLMPLILPMETAILMVGVSVAWPFLAWAAMAAIGALIFDLPNGVLPQWYGGLGAIAIAGTALALNAAVYLGLEDGSASETRDFSPGWRHAPAWTAATH